MLALPSVSSNSEPNPNNYFQLLPASDNGDFKLQEAELPHEKGQALLVLNSVVKIARSFSSGASLTQVSVGSAVAAASFRGLFSDQGITLKNIATQLRIDYSTLKKWIQASRVYWFFRDHPNPPVVASHLTMLDSISGMRRVEVYDLACKIKKNRRVTGQDIANAAELLSLKISQKTSPKPRCKQRGGAEEECATRFNCDVSSQNFTGEVPPLVSPIDAEQIVANLLKSSELSQGMSVALQRLLHFCQRIGAWPSNAEAVIVDYQKWPEQAGDTKTITGSKFEPISVLLRSDNARGITVAGVTIESLSIICKSVTAFCVETHEFQHNCQVLSCAHAPCHPGPVFTRSELHISSQHYVRSVSDIKVLVGNTLDVEKNESSAKLAARECAPMESGEEISLFSPLDSRRTENIDGILQLLAGNLIIEFNEFAKIVHEDMVGRIAPGLVGNHFGLIATLHVEKPPSSLARHGYQRITSEPRRFFRHVESRDPISLWRLIHFTYDTSEWRQAVPQVLPYDQSDNRSLLTRWFNKRSEVAQDD